MEEERMDREGGMGRETCCTESRRDRRLGQVRAVVSSVVKYLNTEIFKYFLNTLTSI